MDPFKKHPGDFWIKFKIGDVFPAADHLASDLLRLMAADEDLSNIERFKTILEETHNSDDTISTTKWKRAQFFLLRLRLGFLCNVLDEVVFKEYRKNQRPRFEELILGMGQKVQEVCRELKETIKISRRGKEIIDKFRNLASFHYGDGEFKNGLNTVATETGKIIFNSEENDVHFIVAYQILDYVPAGVISSQEVLNIQGEIELIQGKLHQLTFALFDEYTQAQRSQGKLVREDEP